MRTFRSCAVSYDNPDYIIRNKYVLLHKDGREYFQSKERFEHPVVLPKPLKRTITEVKFGMSRDYPHTTKYTKINYNTPSLYEAENHKYNLSVNKVPRFSPYNILRTYLHKSRGDTKNYIELLRSDAALRSLISETPSQSSKTTMEIRLKAPSLRYTQVLNKRGEMYSGALSHDLAVGFPNIKIPREIFVTDKPVSLNNAYN